MNRIEHKFTQLKQLHQKAFIAFITAGDPSLRVTEDLAVAFEKTKVDILELGVPFSDPLADGPTIQASSQRALAKGINLEKILQLVKKIRLRSNIPIALMTYFNPVFYFGEERFVRQAKEAGVDGLIIPDLPPEEAKTITASAKKNGLSIIFFLSPTTTLERTRQILKASSGFVYFVSLTGVTGIRKNLSYSILDKVRQVKRMTKQSICVGFGISTRKQVKDVFKIADGVIVGSSIVEEIARNSEKKDLVKRIVQYVEGLCIEKPFYPMV